MILPTKHINFSRSLLGLGSYLLFQLQSPKSIDELWDAYNKDYKNNIYFAEHSFDNLVMTLIFLFGVGSVIEKDGIIEKCV